MKTKIGYAQADILLDILKDTYLDVATVRNCETGEEKRLNRYGRNGLICAEDSHVKLGYWESRFDIFAYACEQYNWPLENCEYYDAQTGEILGFYELADETAEDDETAREEYELAPKFDSAKSFYGKARIICEDGAKILISYETPVCMIDERGEFVRLWDGWSATTARHIDEFRRQNCLRAINKQKWLALPVC